MPALVIPQDMPSISTKEIYGNDPSGQPTPARTETARERGFASRAHRTVSPAGGARACGFADPAAVLPAGGDHCLADGALDAHGGAEAKEFSKLREAGPTPQDNGRGPLHRPARTPDLGLAPATRKAAPPRWLPWLASLAVALPGLALASSPFATGANATQTQLVAILTPLAAVAVMVSGVMAWFGRISWWWMVGVVLGTVLVFGGPQIVSWIRGMFGV